ncbi:hypothetical protein [Bradyrhizobium sp. LHD-71]|uniref:hypothetical protein n=1 Tax=Bradyrhizobium sp. LHD-71 TaxID=3072141 RepID=UPI00280D2FFE|nr:hypothetical protein [Bradyrhizobium sp. LHD-71]MDQ8731068.1 hypothetical protein [Bradyrhizobium sp. LHD-71]
MPAAMPLPDEFRELFGWMEANGLFTPSDAYPGDMLGLLGTNDDLQSDRVTAIFFRVATPEQAHGNGHDWFGDVVPNIEDRLVLFARTGGDGSHAAFWLDDQGGRQIVHLGSEGLVCLLGHTPLDFLRLMAIGYEEISGDCAGMPHKPPREGGRNAAYRAWLTGRYGVTIPETATEILDEIPEPFAETSNDPFWRWVKKHQDERDRDA